jgi:hypothetical protein
MLHCVATFVGCHGGSGYAASIVHIGAEVYSTGERIVVVGQETFVLHNLHIEYAEVPQHHSSHLRSTAAVEKRHLAVMSKLTL